MPSPSAQARLEHHQPVMLDSVIAALAPRDHGLYLDGTFGGGGYSLALLQAANTRVLAIDRDPRAVMAGARWTAAYPDRLELIEGRFAEMDRLAGTRGLERVDGIAL